MEQHYTENDLAGMLQGMQPIQSLSGTGGAAVIDAVNAQLGIDANAAKPGPVKTGNALEDFLNPQHEKPAPSAPVVATSFSMGVPK